MNRSINFGAGPAMLPDLVLQRIRDELPRLPNCGSSILEISHRGQVFRGIMAEAEVRLRRLLQIPDRYAVLFLQGGSRLQFSVVPLNLGFADKSAAYIDSGYWSHMSLEEARRLASVKVIWSGIEQQYARLPTPAELVLEGDWSYVYYTSNETIHGNQFRPLLVPGTAPLVCDMSSDFLSRPVRVSDYALLFACAQKNAGIAGLTIVIVDPRRLNCVDSKTPGYLNLKTHIDSEGLYNTPPTFGIYVLNLMLQWLEDTYGDLAAVERDNLEKSRLIYDAIDRHPTVYRGHAVSEARSAANATFFLTDAEAETRFVDGARQQGMSELKGHRSLGGIRVSLYNALPRAAAAALAKYMDEFARAA
jgi:phosphoserine aminotransferase